MHEAASKTGARSGLSKRRTKALVDMVKASVALLNSGGSTMITLEMQLHEDSLAAKIVGKGCASPTKKLVKQLDVLAEKKTRSYEAKATKSVHTISFEI